MTIQSVSSTKSKPITKYSYKPGFERFFSLDNISNYSQK